MNSGLEEARQLKVPCCLDCLKVMFGLSNRRTRFLSKVSGWGVGKKSQVITEEEMV